MHILDVATGDRIDFISITRLIQRTVNDNNWQNGVLTLFVPHTTAGVTINENADPDVVCDMTMEMNKLVPFKDGYAHMEGNSAAHIKSSLFGCSEQVIIQQGQLMLGTWQGIFYAEFDGPRSRKLYLEFTPL